MAILAIHRPALVLGRNSRFGLITFEVINFPIIGQKIRHGPFTCDNPKTGARPMSPWSFESNSPFESSDNARMQSNSLRVTNEPNLIILKYFATFWSFYFFKAISFEKKTFSCRSLRAPCRPWRARRTWLDPGNSTSKSLTPLGPAFYVSVSMDFLDCFPYKHRILLSTTQKRVPVPARHKPNFQSLPVFRVATILLVPLGAAFYAVLAKPIARLADMLLALVRCSLLNLTISNNIWNWSEAVGIYLFSFSDCRNWSQAAVGSWKRLDDDGMSFWVALELDQCRNRAAKRLPHHSAQFLSNFELAHFLLPLLLDWTDCETQTHRPCQTRRQTTPPNQIPSHFRKSEFLKITF